MIISNCPECGSKNTILYFVKRFGYTAECEECGHSDGFFHTKRGAEMSWCRQKKNNKVALIIYFIVASVVTALVWLAVYYFFNFLSRCAG